MQTASCPSGIKPIQASLITELADIVPEQTLNQILAFDPNQMPPNLEIAQLHRDSARISTAIDGQDGQNHKICPCCCAVGTLQYPLCTPSSEIKNYGPAIPMFFQFSKYLILLAVILFLCSCYGQYEIIRSNCLSKKNYKYNRCGWNLVTLIDVSLRDAGKRYYTNSRYLNLGMNILCLVVLYLLHRAQLRLADDVDKDHLSPADFAVVATHLKEEEANELYVKNYIDSLMQRKGKTPVEILKVNFGRYEGNLVRLERDIQDTEQSLCHFQKLLEADAAAKLVISISSSAENTLDRQSLEQKRTAMQTKLSDLKAKLQRYKDSLSMDRSLRDNSVAFVTLKTQAQALSVLSTQNTRTQYLSVLSRLCGCKKRVLVWERPAEPADYKWKFMGFSILKQAKTVLVAWSICFLLICLSFGIQLGIKLLQKSYVDSLGDTGTWATSLWVQITQLAATLAVGLINKALALVTLRLSRYEKHLTTSDFLVSHTKKLIVFQFANSAGIAVVLLMLP